MALVVLAVGIVFAVPVASAQDLAAADQYTPANSGGDQNPAGGGGQNPAGGDGGNGGQNPAGGDGGNDPAGGGDDVAPAGGDGGPTATIGETGGGDLPFTGYPLTPLLWVVVALVVGGIGFRLVSSAVARRGGASAT